MIELTHRFVRQLRAIVQKSAPLGSVRRGKPILFFHTDRDGFGVRWRHADVWLHGQWPRVCSRTQFTLASEHLDELAGTRDDALTLELGSAGQVIARWDDGLPQVRTFPVATDADSAWPNAPEQMVPIGAGFVSALAEATTSAAHEGNRFALQKLQLRGSTGAVLGTDGQQLFVQGGFHFPWTDDVLIPALPLFGSRELPGNSEVTIGRTDEHVCLRIGPWTLWLTGDTQAKFPDVRSIVLTSGTVCRLAPDDIALLSKALPRLPGKADEHAPITLDLNGHARLRGRANGQEHVAEVTLPQATVQGAPVRCVLNRNWLARALALGCTEFTVPSPTKPFVGRVGTRTFVGMPLNGVPVIEPTAEPIEPGRESLAPPVARVPLPQPTPTPPTTKGTVMIPTKPVDRVEPPTAPTGDLGTALAEAQALKEAVHEIYARTSRLVTALKRQRQQERLVRSTLASLKQLQRLEA